MITFVLAWALATCLTFVSTFPFLKLLAHLMVDRNRPRMGPVTMTAGTFLMAMCIICIYLGGAIGWGALLGVLFGLALVRVFPPWRKRA